MLNIIKRCSVFIIPMLDNSKWLKVFMLKKLLLCFYPSIALPRILRCSVFIRVWILFIPKCSVLCQQMCICGELLIICCYIYIYSFFTFDTHDVLLISGTYCWVTFFSLLNVIIHYRFTSIISLFPSTRLDNEIRSLPNAQYYIFINKYSREPEFILDLYKYAADFKGNARARYS